MRFLLAFLLLLLSIANCSQPNSYQERQKQIDSENAKNYPYRKRGTVGQQQAGDITNSLRSFQAAESNMIDAIIDEESKRQSRKLV